MTTEAFTITFGDRAENHKGMQIIGEEASKGFTYRDLIKIQDWFYNNGIATELHRLHLYCEEDVDKAYVLICRKGVEAICSADDLFEEQKGVTYDTKAFMYGRVVNKHLRHNICYADNSQKANYEKGKGTIVNFNKCKHLCKLREKLQELINGKVEKLMGEGNYYYDLDRCGIGWHGDTERTIVIGVRLGDPFPLHYHWYKNNERIGDRIKLKLGHGDIYFMSEKAVGKDWKSRSFATLRHAAGCKKCLE